MNLSKLTSSVFWNNAKAPTRYIFNQGGTRSSKTYSLMQLAYFIASTRPNIIISVIQRGRTSVQILQEQVQKAILLRIFYLTTHDAALQNHFD